MSILTRLKVGAEILLSITVIIMIIVAGKVISLGDSLGVQILLSSVFFVLFMWLGWQYPKPTGVALIMLGFFVLIIFGNLEKIPEVAHWFGAPILVAGFLFLGAGWKFHPTI